jgi:hypothetical protein
VVIPAAKSAARAIALKKSIYFELTSRPFLIVSTPLNVVPLQGRMRLE